LSFLRRKGAEWKKKRVGMTRSPYEEESHLFELDQRGIITFQKKGKGSGEKQLVGKRKDGEKGMAKGLKEEKLSPLSGRGKPTSSKERTPHFLEKKRRGPTRGGRVSLGGMRGDGSGRSFMQREELQERGVGVELSGRCVEGRLRGGVPLPLPRSKETRKRAHLVRFPSREGGYQNKGGEEARLRPPAIEKKRAC